MDQICMTGESNCSRFSPHMLKANICTNCMKDISKHNENAVTEEDVKKALEFTQKGKITPSLVLGGDDGLGSLYLGGFQSVNETFIKAEGVKGVVNTVGPALFQVFGKKYEKTYNDVIKSSEIDLCVVSWEDHVKYEISDEDLALVLRHTHKVRTAGGSVIVHCAQGKSRSSTAVVAYIMACDMKSRDEALAVVKERRHMAEPNSRFMDRLKEFERSKLRSDLHREFTGES